jgi:hypothetical protein
MIHLLVDAQPIGNFSRVKALGATGLCRYDSGPQKTDRLTAWLDAAKSAGLTAIVQGTACDAQLYTPTDSHITHVAQDDEPDLNRWNASNPQPDLYYSPANAPHPGAIGWTLPDVLARRKASWLRWSKSLIVNFNGTTWTNKYTTAANDLHLPYMPTANVYGVDYHVANNAKPLYLLAHAQRRVNRIGAGNCTKVYFECSDQKLGTGGRCPTAGEMLVEMWGALAYGARMLVAFPQQIGGGFSYWAIPPLLEESIRNQFALIREFEDVIETGKLTLTETPAFAENPAKGEVTYPQQISAEWVLGNRWIKAEIDYATGSATIARMTTTNQPPTKPTEQLDRIEAKLDEALAYLRHSLTK